MSAPSADESEITETEAVNDEASVSEKEAESGGTDIEKIARERDEFRNTAQRIQADFENFRKRALRDQDAAVERATDSVIEQFLSVLDSFELALGSLENETDLEKLRKGVELVYAGFVATLEKFGVQKIDAVGQPFDPNIHDAVVHEDGDGTETVSEVMRNGYQLKDRVIRPAMVRVSRSGNAS